MFEHVSIISLARIAAFLLFLEFSYSSKTKLTTTRTMMQHTSLISSVFYSKQNVAKNKDTDRGTKILKTILVAG